MTLLQGADPDQDVSVHARPGSWVGGRGRGEVVGGEGSGWAVCEGGGVYVVLGRVSGR